MSVIGERERGELPHPIFPAKDRKARGRDPIIDTRFEQETRGRISVGGSFRVHSHLKLLTASLPISHSGSKDS